MSVKKDDRRAANGDALEVLYELHRKDLMERARASVRTSEDAEDLVQDCFLKLAQKKHLDQVNSLHAYLSTILKHSIVTKFRREAVELRHSSHQGASTLRDESADVADLVTEKEDKRLVRLALLSLPERQRRILSMYAEGLTPAQIARRESQSANSISCLIERAKKALQVQLKRMEYVWFVAPRRIQGQFKRLLCNYHRAFDLDPGTIATILAALAILASSASTSLSTHGDNGGEASTVPKLSLVETDPPLEARSSSRNPFTSQSHTAEREALITLNVGGRQLEWSRSQHENEDQGSLADRILEVVQNPDRIEPPSCGGLPICSTR